MNVKLPKIWCLLVLLYLWCVCVGGGGEGGCSFVIFGHQSCCIQKYCPQVTWTEHVLFVQAAKNIPCLPQLCHIIHVNFLYLCSTVSSFLELVPLILRLPGVSAFMSGKLNQDPLETFFGCVRQSGRVNDNHTVAEIIKSTQTFQVSNTIRFSDVKGNCRGNKKNVLKLKTQISACVSTNEDIHLDFDNYYYKYKK